MKRINFIFVFCLISQIIVSQETLPIYSDYLSDNIFLVHPSAAGIGNCGKLRITSRQQFLGVKDAPSLQTLSFHNKISEKAAIGAIIYNEKNGFHSNTGFEAAYAYHLNFGTYYALNQLSFGLSFLYLQNKFDQRSFTSVIPDPAISQTIESTNYYNFDFSVAYHFLDAFSYFTIKNILLTPRKFIDTKFETLNLRRYLLTFGYYLNRNNSFQLEPSIMGQLIERTGELFFDFNLKVFKKIKNKHQIWAAVSYRKNFEPNNIEKFKQISTILGINYKRYMVSYTYSYQLTSVTINNGASHQLTLGINLFCKKPRASGCPNINSLYY